MTKQAVYGLIGDLAICFYSKSIRISYGSLNSILKDGGCAFDNNKELKLGVEGAHKYWQGKDRVVFHAIEYLFSDSDGNFMGKDVSRRANS
jgi:hypothetical protein